MTAPKGLMALGGAALAKIVDDTLAALRITAPTWTQWYGASLPAKVQEMLLEGADGARKSATGDEPGLYSTGGVKVEYDAVGEYTEVWVLIATVYDTEDDDPQHSDGSAS